MRALRTKAFIYINKDKSKISWPISAIRPKTWSYYERSKIIRPKRSKFQKGFKSLLGRNVFKKWWFLPSKFRPSVYRAQKQTEKDRPYTLVLLANRPFFNLPYELFGHIIYGLINFLAINFRPYFFGLLIFGN